MDNPIALYAPTALTVLWILIAYANSNDHAKAWLKRVLTRCLVTFILLFAAKIYAEELYRMIQPGQLVNWQTIVMGHGLLFGLIAFTVTTPLTWWLWRMQDRQNRH